MILHNVEQGSPEWLKARRGIPTASEADRIITAGGKASASQTKYLGELIEELRNPNYVSSFLGNEHTMRGKEYEPKARAWYEFTRPHTIVERVGFVTTDDGMAGCSPDSFIIENGKRGGMELKAPEGKLHAAWIIENGLPADYKQQVHTSMAVTGFDFWDFMSYSPGYKPFCVRVHRDDYTAAVERELSAFVSKLRAARAKFIDYLPGGKFQ